MELIDTDASVAGLLRALLTEVPVRWRAANRLAASSAQIRLRGVVATGYVAIGGHGGWVGSDLDHACRLLDAELLGEALRQRPDDFARCVPEQVHAGILRHGHPGVPRSSPTARRPGTSSGSPGSPRSSCRAPSRPPRSASRRCSPRCCTPCTWVRARTPWPHHLRPRLKPGRRPHARRRAATPYATG
ncbi:hypothetical protein ACFCX0_37745 [Streptomyces sp. NPDC056352]|uniref:hypothetical protein n=1 Tax=Streptomyces sp. NPDC056352 TaxID=3345791 RepID=UPI0035DA0903